MHVLQTEDHDEWRSVLEQTRQHDVHHLPQYHRVAERRGEGHAHLFVYREDDALIALPLLLRPVDAASPAGWRDATSVYGYAGPVASHTQMSAEAMRCFRAELAAELSARNVVAVFSRMHPLLPEQADLLASLGEYRVNGQTISIDLTLSDEAQRAHYNRSCRTALRKLDRQGFVSLHDHGKRYLPEFVDVYLETMRRVRARSSYWFDEAYFDLLTRELGAASQLFVVLRGGEVAAATLCTLCDGIVQDHLGGTRDEFLRFSPDRLIVDTERRWAKAVGARVLHLGGGVGSQEDTVFRYKAGFSDRRHAFCTWRWILRPDVYDALCAEKARWNAANGVQAVSAGYFPAYRCPTAPRCSGPC